MLRDMMNKLLVLAICVISLALSRADEMIDSSYQCPPKLFEYNAATKGEVTSPFYYERDRYHDGLFCEYRIRAPQGYRIKITFKALDIAPSSRCVQDELVVYSKDRELTLGKFCGTELPKPILSLPGESEIRLLFNTDFMVSGKGFVLEYESGPHLGLLSAKNTKLLVHLFSAFVKEFWPRYQLAVVMYSHYGRKGKKSFTHLFLETQNVLIELCDAGLKECRNRNCYDPKKKCDGEDDCGDGTDEEECGFPLVVEPELCGKPVFEPHTIFAQGGGSPDRMVGGESTIPNSWPWQVSLQRNWSEPNGHFCGGTLINAQWVVTATHCVVGYTDPREVRIVIGSHNKFKRTKYEQIRSAVKIIAYPDLEGEDTRRFTMTDDVSLIKLNAPVKFNDGVQPACLPSLGWTAQPGWHCYVTGWGETRGSGGSDVLKQQEQLVQSSQTCSFNEQKQICVEKYQQSPCHGDSGGPLQCKLGGKWFVFGAASYVTTTNYMKGLCTGPGAKTVYAALADKSDWIRSLVNKYS